MNRRFNLPHGTDALPEPSVRVHMSLQELAQVAARRLLGGEIDEERLADVRLVIDQIDRRLRAADDERPPLRTISNQ